jgi:tRNA(Arg) A34 adenosine deaminase TadA
MDAALDQARHAAARGEVPVGAVVVGPGGTIVGAAGNETEAACDPSAHAELLALRRAGQAIGTPRLAGCDLYVTLEPCPMCAHAIGLFRIRRLYFGAYDPKGGGIDHAPAALHRPEIIGGLQAEASAALLRTFFEARRGLQRAARRQGRAPGLAVPP